MVPGKPSGAGGVEPRDSLGAPLRAPYLALLKCASYDPSGRSIPWHSTLTCAIKPHMDGAPIRVRGCLGHPPASMKLEKSWEISIMYPYLAPPYLPRIGPTFLPLHYPSVPALLSKMLAHSESQHQLIDPRVGLSR